MINKIIGSLFLFFAILLSVVSILNNNLIGAVIPVLLYVLSAFFFFGFDRVYNKSFIDGFSSRKNQCYFIIFFLIVYAILMMFTGFSTGVKSSGLDFSSVLISALINCLPFFVPMMVFAVMLATYVISFFACKKNFKLDADKLSKYISSEESFEPCIEDKTVLVSKKIIFFPKIFCIVPFECIDSVKFYNSIEKDIIFTLNNGKKVEIVANKKKFEAVDAAFNLYKSQL